MKNGKVKWTYGNGTEVDKIHLVADEGKLLTKDGLTFYCCVDVDNADGWYEVDSPETDE